MKFNNTVAFCKGFYKRRSGKVRTMWMDMAHCINADGYMAVTKGDVAMYCLARMDELLKSDLFRAKRNLEPFRLMVGIKDEISTYKGIYKEDIDIDDAIILYFKHVVVSMDKDEFEGFILPDDRVLPYNLFSAWYDKSAGKLYPAEMRMDFVERMYKILPDAKPNDHDPWLYDYNSVEAILRIDDIDDVQPVLGSDNLNDCIEFVVSGNDIKKSSAWCKQLDKEIDLDINIYEHCVFENHKYYVVRAKRDDELYDDYKIMSVKLL